MSTAATVFVAIVAIIHIVIAALEIFFWGTPAIYERLGFTPEVAQQVTPIVKNAGLYNGFIAAGLVWGTFTKDSFQIRLFFLICVIIAGIFGAFTLRPTTLLLQTTPAFIALIIVWVARYQSKL